MSEWIVINGHASWCAYIRSLGWIGEDEDCDCVGWDDEEWPATYPTDDEDDWL